MNILKLRHIPLTFLCLSVVAEASTDRIITVNGTCLRKITPDRARVVITSESKESDPKRATAKAQESYQRVLEKVKKLKLPDAEIQTSEYSVDEIKEWENNKQVSRGFRARMGIQVETSDSKRIGEALDIAAKEGVRDVGGLSLFISPMKDRDERNLCLKEAAEQARVKAQKLAEALNARLGEVMQISEGGSSGAPPPRPMYKSMRASDMAVAEAAVSIEAGKEDLSMSVQVIFSLK